MATKTNTVRLNSSELKEKIKYLVKNNAALQSQGKLPISVNIVGPAGISKTACIEQIAEEENLEFVKLSMAQIEDPSDESLN